MFETLGTTEWMVIVALIVSEVLAFLPFDKKYKGIIQTIVSVLGLLTKKKK